MNKITANVMAMACADPNETPRAEWNEDAIAAAAQAEAARVSAAGDDAALSEAAVARRGAEATLRALSAAFGDTLFDAAPKTWEAMSAPLDPTTAATLPPQAVVDGLQIFKTLGPSAATGPATRDKTLALIPSAFDAATRDAAATRVTASNALAALARAHPERVIPELLALVVPALEDAGEADAAAAKRRGAAAVASALVETMGATLAPYCVLLLVPLMGRMSDPTQGTRETATRSFAALVPLLPCLLWLLVEMRYLIFLVANLHLLQF